MSRRPACAVCHHPMNPAVLDDGYRAHPGCDPEGHTRIQNRED